jgi:hypothetical protein
VDCGSFRVVGGGIIGGMSSRESPSEEEDEAWPLPLTFATLVALRAESMSDDVPIDPFAMATLTSAEARAFFEKGGDGVPDAVSAPAAAPPPPPAPASDAALIHLLDDAAAPSAVRDVVGARSYEGWLEFVESVPRPAALAELKRLGVGALGARQAFVNALGRRARAARASDSSSSAPPPPPPPPAPETMAVIVEGGLCNRLRVALSFLAAARAEGRPLLVVWAADAAACPGTFTDCFEPPSDLTICEREPQGVQPRNPPPFADFHPTIKHVL